MCKGNPVVSVAMVILILTGCGVAPEEMGELPLEGEAALAGVQEELSSDAVEELLSSTSNLPMGVTSVQPFSCFVSNNDGCSQYTWCSSGVIVGAKVACNLEVGTVSDGLVSSLPMDWMYVARPSDVVSDGRCFIGDDATSRGWMNISGVRGRQFVQFGCSERDHSSRGDCHISGLLYCGN